MLHLICVPNFFASTCHPTALSRSRSSHIALFALSLTTTDAGGYSSAASFCSDHEFDYLTDASVDAYTAFTVSQESLDVDALQLSPVLGGSSATARAAAAIRYVFLSSLL